MAKIDDLIAEAINKRQGEINRLNKAGAFYDSSPYYNARDEVWDKLGDVETSSDVDTIFEADMTDDKDLRNWFDGALNYRKQQYEDMGYADDYGDDGFNELSGDAFVQQKMRPIAEATGANIDEYLQRTSPAAAAERARLRKQDDLDYLKQQYEDLYGGDDVDESIASPNEFVNKKMQPIADALGVDIGEYAQRARERGRGWGDNQGEIEEAAQNMREAEEYARSRRR